MMLGVLIAATVAVGVEARLKAASVSSSGMLSATSIAKIAKFQLVETINVTLQEGEDTYAPIHRVIQDLHLGTVANVLNFEGDPTRFGIVAVTQGPLLGVQFTVDRDTSMHVDGPAPYLLPGVELEEGTHEITAIAIATYIDDVKLSVKVEIVNETPSRVEDPRERGRRLRGKKDWTELAESAGRERRRLRARRAAEKRRATLLAQHASTSDD